MHVHVHEPTSQVEYGAPFLSLHVVSNIIYIYIYIYSIIIIRQSFIPALIGRQLNDKERRIFALPCRMGGMEISNRVTTAPIEFEMSERMTSTMAALIINQSTQYSTFTQQHLRESRNVLKSEKWQRQNDDLQNLKEVLNASHHRSLSLAGEKVPPPG